jgi:hypothetical protein
MTTDKTTTTTSTSKVAPFKFLSPIDGKEYTLPPYDPALWVDDFGKHKDTFIPKVTMTDALLADDPQEGMDLLKEPMKRINTLLTRSVVKTLKNHLPDADDGTQHPSWTALEAIINAYDFAALSKIMMEWREHYGVEETATEQEVNEQGEG